MYVCMNAETYKKMMQQISSGAEGMYACMHACMYGLNAETYNKMMQQISSGAEGMFVCMHVYMYVWMHFIHSLFMQGNKTTGWHGCVGWHAYVATSSCMHTNISSAPLVTVDMHTWVDMHMLLHLPKLAYVCTYACIQQYILYWPFASSECARVHT